MVSVRTATILAYISYIPYPHDARSIEDNAKEAMRLQTASMLWGAWIFSDTDLYNSVRNGGKWDYKQRGGEWEDFGNFNYGVVTGAYGLSLETSLRGAGWAQQRAGTSDEKEWGDWRGGPPYGDDPKDQAEIRRGRLYYDTFLRNKL